MPFIGRVVLALLVVVLASACSLSRPAPSRVSVFHQPRRHVLPNGMALIIEEHRASDVVALQLRVRAGGRDEGPSEFGLAHYLEHMLFKGTPGRSHGFIDRKVERVGGRINAGTSLDYTYYAAVEVLSAIVGGGMTGRLFVELRDKRGLAYSLGVVNASRAGPAALVSYLGTAPQNAEAAEGGILSQIERMKAEPPADDELARAKAYVLGNLAMDRRTNARQAWYPAFFETLGAGWDFPERSARAVEALTSADVLAAVERCLTRPTIVVLRPPPR